MGKFVEITGERFGRLTAVRPIRENGRFKWVCVCECGGETITTAYKLRSGHTQSCGCLQRERTSLVCKRSLAGERFGRLVAIERIGDMGDKAKYRCKCDCGSCITVDGANLVTGATKSCGCLRKEVTANLKYRHGLTDHRLYRTWQNMRNRCNDPGNKEYQHYGGRGISVCDEWNESFDSFYEWAMSNGYQDDLTIDRIDVNGNYCPENCRWATLHDQSRNRTNNRVIEYQGRKMILADWAKEMGINASVIRHRLDAGWTVEAALTKPIKGPK